VERAVNILRNLLFRRVSPARTAKRYRPIIGSIDQPRDWFIAGAPLNVRGWAVGGDPMRSIEVYWDNRFLGNAKLGRPRSRRVKLLWKYPEDRSNGFEFDAEKPPHDAVGTAVELRVIATASSGYSKTLTTSLTAIASADDALNFLKKATPREAERISRVCTVLFRGSSL
jgi:hypothetical protein